jgi:hypothetical protein
MVFFAWSRLVRSPRKPVRPRLEALERRFLPSTFTVVDLGDAGIGSGLQGDLRYAIDTANTNGEPSNQIVFDPSLSGTITLTRGELAISSSLEIDGPGASLLTVSGNHQSGVFDITAASRDQQVSLANLTIADGIGIQVSSDRRGGGLYNTGATVTLTAVTVTGNSVNGSNAPAGGGLYNDTGALTVQDSTVAGNSVSGGGSGGGIFDFKGPLVLDSCTVADNQVLAATHDAFTEGGGIATSGVTGGEPVTLSGCTISGNSVAGTNAFGGGVQNIAHRLTIDGCTITGNSSDQVGGGISSTAATTSVTNSVIAGNFATRGGGGVENNNGRVTLTDSTIADNTCSTINGFGGGITNNSQMTVSGCTLSGNSALDGGAIFQGAGTMSLTNCTISGNTAAQAGGGIYANQGALGILQLTSVTITGNSAGGTAGFDRGGGGLWLYPPGITTPNRVYLHNTLVAGNSTASLGPDVNGTVLSMGYNLVGEVDDSQGWASTDLTGTVANPLDPHLGPLQDNGGPTTTHALLAGSPAIMAGDLALRETFDQRGTDRIGSHPPDIGAFQAERIFNLRISAPVRVTAGEAFFLTVTALDIDGHTASTFVGAIHFVTSDPDGVVPDDYTFTPQDGGVHTFTVTLQTIGPQTIRATDQGNPFHTDTATVTVDPPGNGPDAPAIIRALTHRDEKEQQVRFWR